MLVISEPFQMLWGVKAFLKVNETHWAKSSFAPFFLFVKVQNFLKMNERPFWMT
jgi:hypothetical protein